MKKLKLNKLQVESFEIDSSKKENGTVKGNCGMHSTTPPTKWVTCAISCDRVCDPSVDDTCHYTCLIRCTHESCAC